MSQRAVVYRVHAVQRMAQRHINISAVQQVLDSGETIEEYPSDTPYPSRLVLGWHGDRPLHVVVADNSSGQEWIVITVYEPDRTHWSADFRRRQP